jgi:spore maturation protein CgeB
MAQYDLRNYDGVLVYGAALRDVYLKRGLAKDVWVWHEAADTRVFGPKRNTPGNGHAPAYEGDLVWIGNWGDDERASEIREFLIEPTVRLGLKTRVYGVRYPKSALEALEKAGIEYAGWLPNFQVPDVFSRFRVTVHIPRRAYVDTLHGIPTIRPFEAMACGIPLVCSPWSDWEGLFSPGQDYLVARDGAEMTQHLRCILQSPRYAEQLINRGLQTIRRRHTCAHRVDELLAICYRVQIAALGVAQ